MSDLRQRREPIRSAAIRDSAKGAPCMLNFPCCNHDPETSVWAHWRDESFGRSRKAHDTSGFPACSSCHWWLDVGWAGKMTPALIHWYVLRALQRAFVWLIDTGAVEVKLDTPKPSHAKPAAKRKPPEQRAKIATRPTEWPKRELRSRNNLRKEPTA